MLILEPNLHPPPEMSSNNLMGHITDLADATKGWLPFRRAVRGCHCGSGTSVPRPRACRESSEISWNGPRDSHSRIPSAIATPVVFQNPASQFAGVPGNWRSNSISMGATAQAGRRCRGCRTAPSGVPKATGGGRRRACWGLGEKPSPSGVDWSMLAVLSTTANPVIQCMALPTFLRQ